MVKPGYKQSEVGIIPEDWGVSTLRAAFPKLEAGVSVNSDNMTSSKYHVLKTSAVHNGIVDPAEVKPVIKADYSRLKCPLVQGSIIISRMNTPALVGECGYVKNAPIDVYLPDRLWQIQNPKDSDYNFEWLNYLLNTKRYRDAVRATATGTSNSMKNISKERLMEIDIPCPSLDEQNRISAALSDIDTLIANLEKLIAKKKAIKQGAMQELLTGKRRLPGFDGEWITVTVGEICNTSSGGTPSRQNEKYYSGNIPWFTTSELTDTWLTDSLEHITNDAIDNSAAKIFATNTILLAMYGATIGKLGILKIPAASNQACCALMCKKDDFLFLFYKLMSMRQELISLGCGAGQPNISQEIVKGLSINLPESIDEQKAISEILSHMDEEITSMICQLKKYQGIRDGMMSELLTGRIRLI